MVNKFLLVGTIVNNPREIGNSVEIIIEEKHLYRGENKIFTHIIYFEKDLLKGNIFTFLGARVCVEGILNSNELIGEKLILITQSMFDLLDSKENEKIETLDNEN